MDHSESALFQAALAYLGARRGHTQLSACMDDEWVREGAEQALAEAVRAQRLEAGLPEGQEDGMRHAAIALTRTSARGESVAQVAAGVLGKLKRDGLLTGETLLARRHGITPVWLIRTIAAALHYQAPHDPEAQQMQMRLQALDLPAAVRELCELRDVENDLARDIVRAYRRLPLEDEWSARALAGYKTGFEYEKLYRGCGQCTLTAVTEAIGRFDDGAFEAATALAGGLGRCGDGVCGALMGASLACGLLYPRRHSHFDGDADNKERSISMVQRLRERFLQRYGGIHCHEIHRARFGRAFDLRNPDDQQAFDLAGAHETECTDTVGLATQWALEVIAQEQIEDALNAAAAQGL